MWSLSFVKCFREHMLYDLQLNRLYRLRIVYSIVERLRIVYSIVERLRIVYSLVEFMCIAYILLNQTVVYTVPYGVLICCIELRLFNIQNKSDVSENSDHVFGKSLNCSRPFRKSILSISHPYDSSICLYAKCSCIYLNSCISQHVFEGSRVCLKRLVNKQKYTSIKVLVPWCIETT